MKKILIPLLLLAMFAFTGCKSESARSIVGHTYGVIESANSMFTIYFSPSETASINFINGDEKLITSHFTYDINDDDVEVYYDYSDYWIETAKGELFIHLTYDPIDDTLNFLGDILHRID